MSAASGSFFSSPPPPALRAWQASGFFDLFISGWRTHVGVIEERKNALRVYGPTNTREIIEPIRRAMDYDIGFRLDYNKSNPRGAQIESALLDEGVIYERDGVRVTVFTVDHRPVEPAVGYVFEYGGKKLVISGDTRPVRNTVEHAQGADLLIHEAYQRQWLDAISWKKTRLLRRRSSTRPSITRRRWRPPKSRATPASGIWF